MSRVADEQLQTIGIHRALRDTPHALKCGGFLRLPAGYLPRAQGTMQNPHMARDTISFVVMHMDGAAWHTSPKLQVPENIRLLTQPAYSPERNPVEHLWDDIREKAFPNVLHETLEQVQQAVSTGLRRLAAAPEHLSSMTFFPHICTTWRQLAWSWACAAWLLQSPPHAMILTLTLQQPWPAL